MRKRLLLLGAGIILTFFVVNLFGLAEVAAALARANPAFVAGAAGLQLAALTLYAARLRAIGGGFISFAKALRVTLAGGFVSLITPIAKIGGEPLKMYMIRDNYGGS
ncbi:MAG: lysylphosphatidylglycerol synthase domain-containing protein, partial [Candidatus Aenigmatarchaeota archaeon]